jgi:hypothetical protein
MKPDLGCNDIIYCLAAGSKVLLLEDQMGL